MKMPLSSLTTEEALVEWVNKGFPITTPITSIIDLQDGVALSEILTDLDSTYNGNDIDADPAACARWITKKRNLQAVHRALFRFIHREAPDLEVLSRLIDIRELSDSPDAEGVAQLLYITIAAAFLGPDPEKYVRRLQEPGRFDHDIMFQIQQIIMNQQQVVSRETEKANREPESADVSIMEDRDSALAYEEERATILSQLDLAHKTHADTMSRLEHLQDSYEALKLEEARLQRELDVLRKITQDGASDSQIIKALEDKIKEQDELIANQESQAEEDRAIKTKLTNELTTLRQKSERADALDDELKELKYRMEELNRKANAAERYKQKLEGQQHLQREVQNLQFEKDQLQETLREHEKLILRNQALEKTLAEVRRLHSAAEGEVYELTTQKQVLEDDIRTLQHQLALMEERKNHDERFISELQEQLNSGESRPVADTPMVSSGGFSLEDELEGATDPAQNLELEISRLKAENNLLKKGLGGSSETTRLKDELEEERRKHQRLKDQHDEIMTKHALAEEQVNKFIQEAVNTGDEALKFLSERLRKTMAELDHEKVRVEELERQLTDKDRDLLSARTDLSMVDKDTLEGIEELKNADGLMSTSLRTELEAMRIRLTNSQDDLEHHRRQLIEALLAKDRYRKEAEEHRSNPGSGDAAGAAEEALKKQSEKIEKLRERLKQRQSQLEKAELEKHELQRKLKAALEGEALVEQRTMYEVIIKNLQRENDLITTAWYDVNSRIQSSHVVVQRRQEVPRSWIGKQRLMVNNATPRR